MFETAAPGDPMTARDYRLIALILPFAIATHRVEAQGANRLDAGAGAGGSVFGWQPRVGIGADLPVISLGNATLSWRGALDRVSASNGTSPFELVSGARVSLASATSGWWLGSDVVHRSGFKDAVEEPRVETGGWRRIGSFVLSISGARRSSSSLSTYGVRRVTSYFKYVDTLTGRWDSTLVSRTVGDSSRGGDQHRWAETEAGLLWEGQRVSASLAVGGRLASRDVPSATWGSASLIVRLASPISLVLGAGGASGAPFVLNGEHRFVSAGLRVTPWRPSAAMQTATTLAPADAAPRAFIADRVRAGVYRLMLSAPSAQSVELSGDFTNWKPVPLVRGTGGVWSIELPLAAGTHRVNARIDGGRWIVPPGLTTMSDDFAGEVGLLVIDASREMEDPWK
jgi:predicted carbohydrate-binding protein with CBM48